MPFIFKLLKAASLTAATNDSFYKVGTTANTAATSAIISNIRVYNTSGATVTVDIFVRTTSAGTQVRIGTQLSVPATSSKVFNANELTLAKDSVIDVNTSGAGVVNCIINGAERV